MVQSYNEYLRLLEDAVVKNGRRALSDLQIDQFIRHNKLDSDWQIIASEVEEDMMMIVKRIGNVAPSIPRNLIAPKLSATGAKVKKVKNYREYQLLLEKAIELNGKKELSSYQIDDFVRRNNLYVDWGIVSSEVKKDMEDLLSQYQQLSANASPFVKKTSNSSVESVARAGSRGSSHNKLVKSYDAYMQLLEAAMIKNSKAGLSEEQIKQFISANKLFSDWGITSVEVRKDMTTISARFARQEKSEALRAKYGKKTGKVYKRNDPLNVSSVNNQNNVKKSGLTDADKEIVVKLRDMMQQYPDVIDNSRRLKAAVADILPEKKKEINLLGTLAEEDIIQVIRNAKSLDQVLCDRFAMTLEEQYGTSMELARRMVLIWFHAYGRLILNIDIELR